MIYEIVQSKPLKNILTLDEAVVKKLSIGFTLKENYNDLPTKYLLCKLSDNYYGVIFNSKASNNIWTYHLYNSLKNGIEDIQKSTNSTYEFKIAFDNWYDALSWLVS